MTAAAPHRLFTGLIHDASMLPPGVASLREAVTEHCAYRTSRHAIMVGPLVCIADRLAAVDARSAAIDCASLEVSVSVPAGLETVPIVLTRAAACRHLTLGGIEVPLGTHYVREAIRRLGPVMDGRRVYLDIRPSAIDERHAHDLAPTGLILKLRAGGTQLDPFVPEQELARCLVVCAAERLQFACTSGLHRAVRHTDPQTRFERHGFLNIAWAARVAASTGSVEATRAALAERDSATVAAALARMSDADVVAIRAIFESFAACSVTDAVEDLRVLGLAGAP